MGRSSIFVDRVVRSIIVGSLFLGGCSAGMVGCARQDNPEVRAAVEAALPEFLAASQDWLGASAGDYTTEQMSIGSLIPLHSLDSSASRSPERSELLSAEPDEYIAVVKRKDRILGEIEVGLSGGQWQVIGMGEYSVPELERALVEANTPYRSLDEVQLGRMGWVDVAVLPNHEGVVFLGFAIGLVAETEQAQEGLPPMPDTGMVYSVEEARQFLSIFETVED